MNKCKYKYHIEYIPFYPEDGKHLLSEVDVLEGCVLDMEISLGYDSYFYINSKGKECQTKTHLWTCSIPENNIYKIKEVTRQFKTVEKAIEYGVDRYKKFLLSELKKIEGE